MNYVLLALLWSVWCAVHSILISVTVTEFSKRRLGTYYRFYRLFFNIVAVVTIIPIVLYGHSVDGQVLFTWRGFLIVFQVFLLVLAAALFVAGARHYDMLQLAGVRQAMGGNPHSVLTETGKISTSGVLSVTRHPWYLASILLVWTANCSMNTSALITSIVLTVYLIVGTLMEERKLLMEFGEEYREYQRRVSMLFPIKWLMSFLPRGAK
jgi:protein-S-isoprenylcysteine O-methyltransferase Ste14